MHRGLTEDREDAIQRWVKEQPNYGNREFSLPDFAVEVILGGSGDRHCGLHSRRFLY